MTGSMISHYRIHEKLGEGGMGVVYKATDTKLDRSVALKFLPGHLSQSENDKMRFIQEARAASALDHPNICTIYEISETPDGDLVIVMPAYDGSTLSKRIENGPMKKDEALDIAVQVAEGLHAAHEKGIIHRDLKSGNILVTGKGQVKIIDFGLARRDGATQLTKTGTTVGTVPYMSPEQTRGEKLDTRSDIWSLGILIYQMISGRLPFHSDYSAAVVYAILNEEPEPLTALRSDVPMELERIVKKCMQKDRNYRYRTVDELLVDLKTLQRDQKDGKMGVRLPKSDSERNSRGSGIEPPEPVADGSARGRTAVPVAAVFTVTAVAVAAALLATVWFFYPASAGEEIRSIAVLPLTNLSADPDQEYFSDGMTEALITDLAGIEALRVISRTTIMQYKATTKSLPEIARELDVDAIVEASVMRSGDQVRISARLIHGTTERHLWSDSYVRDMRDILMLQNDVARAIAGEIRIKITQQEFTQLASAQQINTEAYEAVLRGRYFWNRRTPESLRRAAAFFEEAIALDPLYAEGYRGLAATNAVMGVFFANPHEVFPKAAVATEKALELDPKVVGGNLAFAVINKYYNQNRSESIRYIDRAVELHPGIEHVYNVRGMFYASVGRFDEAIAQFQKALNMDPLSLAINADFGWSYYLMGEYDKAIQQCRKSLDIDPNFLTAYSTTAAAHTMKGESEKAITILEPVIKRSGSSLAEGPSFLLAELGFAYAKSGKTEQAGEVIAILERRSQHEFTDPYFTAMIYLAMEETDTAFEWLYKSFEARSSRLAWLDVDPKLNPLRNDERFFEFRSKTGYAG
jgi:eukaryotic-like serine/threonine-protein kinase